MEGPALAVLAITLAAVVGEYALSLVAELLNHRALRQPLPSEFADTYDALKYARSQEYTMARSLFSVAHSTADLLILVVFWFVLRSFEWLDLLVREAFPADDPWVVVPRGLMYWGIFIGVSSLLDLPWAVYSTFVIEQRFGFNTTTVGTFILDRLKGLTLALLLGPPVCMPNTSTRFKSHPATTTLSPQLSRRNPLRLYELASTFSPSHIFLQLSHTAPPNCCIKAHIDSLVCNRVAFPCLLHLPYPTPPHPAALHLQTASSIYTAPLNPASTLETEADNSSFLCRWALLCSLSSHSPVRTPGCSCGFRSLRSSCC